MLEWQRYNKEGRGPSGPRPSLFGPTEAIWNISPRAKVEVGQAHASPHQPSVRTLSLMKTPSIDLKANTKSAIIEVLNARLADAIDLALITKQAHWNLKGPNFIAVHEMLDPMRASLDEHVDVIAERIAQLDGIALGTSQIVAKASSLDAYPTDIRKVTDHLAALAERYASLANQVRKDIDNTDEAGDADSADILTAFSRDLDKNLWFIKSHLE